MNAGSLIIEDRLSHRQHLLKSDNATSKPNAVDRLHAVRMQRGHRNPIPLLQSSLTPRQPTHPTGINASIDRPSEPRDSRAAAVRGAVYRGNLERKQMTREQNRLKADQQKKLRQESELQAKQATERKDILSQLAARRTGIDPRAEEFAKTLTDEQIRVWGGKDAVLRELTSMYESSRPLNKAGPGFGRDTGAPTSGLPVQEQKQNPGNVSVREELAAAASRPVQAPSITREGALGLKLSPELTEKLTAKAKKDLETKIVGGINFEKLGDKSEFGLIRTALRIKPNFSLDEIMQTLPPRARKTYDKDPDRVRLIVAAMESADNPKEYIQHLIKNAPAGATSQDLLRAMFEDAQLVEERTKQRLLTAAEREALERKTAEEESKTIEEEEKEIGFGREWEEKQRKIREFGEAQASEDKFQKMKMLLTGKVTPENLANIDTSTESPRILLLLTDQKPIDLDIQDLEPSLDYLEAYDQWLKQLHAEASQKDRRPISIEIEGVDKWIEHYERRADEVRVTYAEVYMPKSHNLDDLQYFQAVTAQEIRKDMVKNNITATPEFEEHFAQIDAGVAAEIEKIKEGEEAALSKARTQEREAEIESVLESDIPEQPSAAILKPLPTANIPIDPFTAWAEERAETLIGEGMVNDFVSVVLRSAKAGRSKKKKEKLTAAVNQWLAKHPSKSVEDIPKGTVTKFINMVK